MKKPIIIENIGQGTDEWKMLRLGKATASEFKRIITPKTSKLSSGYDTYAMELAMQKYVCNVTESYKSQEMARGNELESLARQSYQEKTFNDVKEVTFLDCGDYGCSPDGLVGDDGMIEIKCMNVGNHANAFFTKQVPDEHYVQCQGSLMVSGRKWLDFVSYNPDLSNELDTVIIRMYPDQEFITKLYECLEITINKRNEYIKICESNNF